MYMSKRGKNQGILSQSFSVVELSTEVMTDIKLLITFVPCVRSGFVTLLEKKLIKKAKGSQTCYSTKKSDFFTLILINLLTKLLEMPLYQLSIYQSRLQRDLCLALANASLLSNNGLPTKPTKSFLHTRTARKISFARSRPSLLIGQCVPVAGDEMNGLKLRNGFCSNCCCLIHNLIVVDCSWLRCIVSVVTNWTRIFLYCFRMNIYFEPVNNSRIYVI